MGSRLAKLVGGCLAGGVLVAGVLAPPVIGVALAATVALSGTTAQAPFSLAALTALPAVTTVTDRDGTPIATLYQQYRLPLTSSRISPLVSSAVVAVEDRRFYQESAIDPRGLARAALNDLTGGATEGGSTITQQLVKNYLVNVADRNDPAAQAADRADTLSRKLTELGAAATVDRSLSKDQILTGYLNVVAFTGDIHGIGAAARAYFHRDAADLTLPQAALLAGMVNNPTLFDPYRHPAAALTRRGVVLDAMVSTGAISPRTAAAAARTPLGVLGKAPAVPPSDCYGAAPDAGFLCDYAVRYVEQSGLSAAQLTTGGYTIRTTLDPQVAQAARAAVVANVPTAQPGVANTLAVIAPGTDRHQVLAMVANRDFGGGNASGQTAANIVADVSDPFGAGSSFKIFTAAAALASGTAGLDTQLPNPPTLCVPTGQGCYEVHNDGSYPASISLTDGLATSPNTAFVGLEQRVGLPAVLTMANRLGLRNTLRTNASGHTPVPSAADARQSQPQSRYFADKPSFTLGDSPVSPLELANVSATLMSGGTWCPPDPVLSVTDRTGAAVPLHTQACDQAVSAPLANTLMAGLSKDTVSGTSAAAARAAHWTRPGIGKTGTTQESESVAFVGGADGYAVSSLVFADGRDPAELCPGPPVHLGDCGSGAFGGTVAAPPYFRTLSTLLAGQPDTPVPPPDPHYVDPAVPGP